MLTKYITDTRALLRDSLGLFATTQQITTWINDARAQVAKQTGCLRALASGRPPFGDVAVPGRMTPGASSPGSTRTTFRTIAGVEKYPFQVADAIIAQQYNGFGPIIDVIDVAVAWGSERPAMTWMPWEDLQAYARAYNVGVTSYPYFWSTSGYGDQGLVWLFPIPSFVMEMEWDCTCVPTPLYSDSDPEALPGMLRDSVKFYAAHLQFLASQRFDAAGEMLKMFVTYLVTENAAADRGKSGSYYWNE